MIPEWINTMNTLGREKIPFLFILDFNLEETFVLPIDSIDPAKILFHFPGFTNSPIRPRRAGPITIKSFPPAYASFLQQFNAVQQEIHAGNTYLLNLTFATPIELNASLEEVFLYSQSKYKLFVRDRFVLFSPEPFVRIKDGKIYTYPMKGTMEKIDEYSVHHLLNDKKEEAEHATITDLLRNDIGRVADNIRVNKYRYVEEIRTIDKTILQVSSEIMGEITLHFSENIGSLFNELLPAGSVTGAPKKKTVDIIHRIENHDRGFYTGIFGMFDGQTVDSSVMIRFIEKQGEKYFYKSGGGITFMSDPGKEYREIKQKIYVPVH